MSDTTPAPDSEYSDGKSENFEPDPNANAVADDYTAPEGSGENIGGDAAVAATDTDTGASETGGLDPASTATPAADQVPTDNGGTTPDTTPTEPVAGEPADTTTGAVEGGDTVAGSGPGVAEADPEAPAVTEPEVQEAGEELEPATEAPVDPLGPDVDAPAEPPVVDVQPSVEEVPVPAAADSEGDEHHVWTIWSRKRKAWFNVVEDEGIVGEPNGYRLKTSAKSEGRDEARARGVIHFIQKKNGDVGEDNSYGYRAKHEL
jgi:hypothetical protein